MLTAKTRLVMGALCVFMGLFTDSGMHAMTIDQATGVWGAQSGGALFPEKECVSESAAEVCNLVLAIDCFSEGTDCSECHPDYGVNRTHCADNEIEECFKALDPPATDCGNRWGGACATQGGCSYCSGLMDSGCECNETEVVTNKCRIS
ncbi:MAG: hypothetical protein H6825_12895 [Planctomycetes bacterium]|nr:hypothetical protein [Planctomycetota bacterium]